jgi:formate/nitrite transporter
MSLKTPPEVAVEACVAARKKSEWTVSQMAILGGLAGAYIALAGYLYAIVTQDAATFSGIGVSRFLGGSVFSLGLILVVLAGAELFTGNCLMPLGSFAGCVSVKSLLRNWFWVYLSNLAGSLLVVAILFGAGLLQGPIGVHLLKISAAKVSLPFTQALLRGILCNWLVVLGVWMAMAATDVTGKILAIYFPIMAFVASGFEHCIANMFFIPAGILASWNPEIVASAGLPEGKLAIVNVSGFLHNLLPVTIGNIIGGALFVAVLYYVVYKERVRAS